MQVWRSLHVSVAKGYLNRISIHWQLVVHSLNNVLNASMSFQLLSVHPVTWSGDDVMCRPISCWYSSQFVVQCNALERPEAAASGQTDWQNTCDICMPTGSRLCNWLTLS